MNQPWQERFERLENEQRQLKEEVRQLRQQITEPIRIDRLEIDRGGTQDLLKETNKKLDQIIQTQTDRSEKFDTLERGQQSLKQELHAISKTWLDTLQEHYDEHKQAISDVQTVLKGHSKYFEEHGKRLATTATKEDIASVKSDIATMVAKEDIKDMATKQDISAIRTEMVSKADVSRIETMMQTILSRLPEPGAGA